MNLKKTYRPEIIRILFPIAQLAFVAAILLGRLDNPDLSFLEGALMGFAMVGNLAFLIHYRCTRQSSDQ